MIIIPKEKIEEVKNTADIVDVVSEAVLLKKAGVNHVGLCPFHSEKTPSFTVSSEKKIFHCFGCGEGGDVIHFIEKQEGISFLEATQMLARRYGINLPQKSMSKEQHRQMTEREQLFKINQMAKNFFCYNLSNTEAGRMAMNYLKNRGVTKEIIDLFSIGFAPDGWENIVRYFKKKNISLGLIEKTGLIVKRGEKSGFRQRSVDNGYYDRFRNRIIFPISDLVNQVTGFGGRVMDNSLPKYLNSPETALYKKSKLLYGLNKAKPELRATNCVYVVEGYMDLIAMYQNGIKNVVAILGTALTSDHAKIIKGNIGQDGKAILVYDSDEAGIKAAKKSISIFDKESVDAYILKLPKGYDPDSYLLEFGREPFVEISKHAPSTMFFLMDSSIEKHGNSIEGKIRVLSDLIEPLSLVGDNVKRSLYIRELTERLGIDESAILEKIRQAQTFRRNDSLPTRQVILAKQAKRKNSEGENVYNDAYNKMEKRIISMMLQFPDALEEVRKRNILRYFKNNSLKSIGDLIIEQMNSQNEKRVELDVSELMSMVNEPEKKRLIASLNIGDDIWNYKGCLNLMEQFVGSRNRRESTLLEKIKAAEKSNDQELLLKLLREKQIQATSIGKDNLESAGGESI